jgi:hypothetical protein
MSSKVDFLIVSPARLLAPCVQSGKSVIYILSSSHSGFLLCSRLPVRALMFHCSICSHGGHQACYRSYYAQRPMMDFLGSSAPAAPSSHPGAPALTQRTGSESTDEDAGSMTGTFNSSIFDSSIESSPVRTSQRSLQRKLAGRPCAAGCGHFCWATNAITDES